MFIFFAFLCFALDEPAGDYYVTKTLEVAGGTLTLRVEIKDGTTADINTTWAGETYFCADESFTITSNVIYLTNFNLDGNCVKEAIEAAQSGVQVNTTYDGTNDTIVVTLTNSFVTETVVLEKVYTSAPTRQPTRQPTRNPTPKPTRTPEPSPNPTEEPTTIQAYHSAGGPNAGGGSDPHFHLFNKKLISYHGECDLVLLSCPDLASEVSMDIQIRTRIKNNWSFIQGVAMKFGDDNFEWAGKGEYYVNNKIYREPPAEFAGYYVQKLEHAPWCRDKCSNAVLFKFHFGIYGSVELSYWNNFLHVEVSGPGFDNCTGFLGQSSKRGMVARNGTVMEDINQYGQEWQVSDKEINLFRHKWHPQHPNPCILPNKDSRRLVGLSTHLMAVEACSHLPGPLQDMCIFDVEATGDVLMAYAPMFG